MAPPTSCTSYTLSASVAGPLITAPVVMSNREPWHWHMIVVPVSRPPESGHTWSVQVHNASTEPGADDHHVVVEGCHGLAPSLVVMACVGVTIQVASQDFGPRGPNSRPRPTRGRRWAR